MWKRRDWMVAALALAAGSAEARRLTEPAPRLAATWATDDGHQVGIVGLAGSTAVIEARLDVPTRAHGLWAEAGGTLLTVARRPGDWLLRWRRDGRALAWAWIEPDRAFNGHVLASPDGRTLYTTESDLQSGQGLIGVRDAASLQKRAEWPTHGCDPHELLWDRDGRLVVANGGIATRPETGRQKLDLAHMDSSLVRLEPARGELLSQWRLDDQRLSLRHLARLDDGRFGIALQAEHDEAGRKQAAPVLALFDGRSLRTADLPDGSPLQGYGGDIAAWDDGFAVSCPRAACVALWRHDGRFAGRLALDEACALASRRGRLWTGGREAVLDLHTAQLGQPSARPLGEALRLDNHWVPLPAR